jgi:hypothetical protein
MEFKVIYHELLGTGGDESFVPVAFLPLLPFKMDALLETVFHFHPILPGV